MEVNKIIFVCTGNTCRSPMAEGLMKQVVDKKIMVVSRGLMAFGHEAAQSFAVKAMEEKGINISSHVSKPFDIDEVGDTTLILTMTKRHKEVITRQGIIGNVFTIKEYIGIDGDIDDPYGGTMDVYRTCADELADIISQIGGSFK